MTSYNLQAIDALRSSSTILSQAQSAAVITTAKNVITGTEPIPRNIGEAIQLFTGEVFGAKSDPFYYRSQYGSPIYSYLLIKGSTPTELQTRAQLSTLSSYRVNYVNPENKPNPNTWTTIDNDLTVQTRDFPAIFMDSAIMSVDKKKNIVKTKIVNKNSTRKEYISDGDYSVKLSGVFTTDESALYPTSDVDALRRACEAPIPLEVVSPFLFRFGITKLVVDSFSFPQERGSYASQKFSINFTSHESSYEEIGSSLLNENQKKNFIQQSLDDIQNLRNKVDAQTQSFLANEALNIQPLF